VARSTGSSRRRDCRIELLAARQHAEAEHQKLAHCGHYGLFAFEAPLDLQSGGLPPPSESLSPQAAGLTGAQPAGNRGLVHVEILKQSTRAAGRAPEGRSGGVLNVRSNSSRASGVSLIRIIILPQPHHPPIISQIEVRRESEPDRLCATRSGHRLPPEVENLFLLITHIVLMLIWGIQIPIEKCRWRDKGVDRSGTKGDADMGLDCGSRGVANRYLEPLRRTDDR
jgi:hypothetical protein